MPSTDFALIYAVLGKARAAGAQSYLEDYTSSVFRDGENGGSRVASRAAVRDCESVTELLGGGLHSG